VLNCAIIAVDRQTPTETRESISPRNCVVNWKKYSKIFRLWSFVPKPSKLKGVKQVRYSDQPIAQGMHCRGIVFIPLCTPKATGVLSAVSFFVRRMVWLAMTTVIIIVCLQRHA